MIDLHTHMTPGVDDGIETKASSDQAIKKSIDQGVTMIALTPHITCGKLTKDQYLKLKEAMAHVILSHPELTILTGCELMLNDACVDTLNNGLYFPIQNTDYLLCEGNVRHLTEEFTENFDYYAKVIIDHGLHPIIAHVERYFHDQIDLEYIAYLKKLGAIIQVNSSSILSPSHSEVYQNTIALLDAFLVDIIASDTHQDEGPRSPNLALAYQKLKTLGFDHHYLNDLFSKNQVTILNNESLTPKTYKKRSFFKRHFKH